jgi:hypothetical protein
MLEKLTILVIIRELRKFLFWGKSDLQKTSFSYYFCNKLQSFETKVCHIFLNCGSEHSVPWLQSVFSFAEDAD